MWTPQPPPPRPPAQLTRAGPRFLSERQLADAWEQRAYLAHYLVDCCGRHLRVIFPGRRWGGPGPDFLGAVLAERDGALVRGDVELHVRASGWAAHRHASDPRYAQVVLHVVQEADAVALDARGQHLPTVELVPEPGRGPPRQLGAPCLRAARSVLHVVEAAGRERFEARVARFEGDLSAVEADQVLWRGVCEALGFRQNTAAFGRLAEAVPWALAAQVAIDRGPVGVAGLLLGSAGLIAEASLPEAHAWRAVQRTHGVRPALGAAAWQRHQVRGRGAPEQRCRGLGELAARWVEARPRAGLQGRNTLAGRAGGYAGPADQVIQAVRAAAGQRRPTLWRLVRASPWIGRGRAQVIVVNVLVPFAAAAGVSEAAMLFERLPGEPSNRVVRYMSAQLGGPALSFRGACRQQGLLQLFQLTCARRVCERCPAAKRRPGATRPADETSKEEMP